MSDTPAKPSNAAPAGQTDENKGEYGEGNYKAAREYNEETTAYAQSHSDEDIARTARDAAKALDGDEAADLEAAEAEGKSHAKK
ncbi:hypothetical protein ACOYW6_11425 [Parablastomonas sp. CN1-191]|uniref:hypothetical protein n=1 Tax=Parablastomonas sp. CN1-191 TaxID=3400908 RepID=UPI003BF7923A